MSDNAVQALVASSRHEFIDIRPLRVTLRQPEDEETELSLVVGGEEHGSRLEQLAKKPTEISIQTETPATFVSVQTFVVPRV